MITKQGILRFGTGDILVTPLANNSGNGVLIFQNQEEEEIGRQKLNKNFKRNDNDTLMYFTDTRSIDVIIEKLERLKSMMKGDFTDCMEYEGPCDDLEVDE